MVADDDKATPPPEGGPTAEAATSAPPPADEAQSAAYPQKTIEGQPAAPATESPQQAPSKPPRPKRVIKRKTKGMWKRGDHKTPSERLPQSFQPKIAKELISLRRQGITQEVATSSAGVARKTLYNWLRRGLRSKKLEQGDPDKSPTLEKFRADWRKAEKWAIRQWHLRLQGFAQQGDKDVIMWFLERFDRKTYGRQDRIEHANPDGSALDLAPKVQVLFNLPSNGRDVGGTVTSEPIRHALPPPTPAPPPVEAPPAPPDSKDGDGQE